MDNQVTLTLSTQEAYDVLEALNAMHVDLLIARDEAENPADIIDPAIYEDLRDKVKGQI